MTTIPGNQSARFGQDLGLECVSALSRDDQRNLLRLAMARLPYIDRVAIALRFWENCSIEEISNFLGLDWDETDKRLNRSVKVLRVALREFSLKRTVADTSKKPCLEPVAA